MGTGYQDGWVEAANGRSFEWLFVELHPLIGFSKRIKGRHHFLCQLEVVYTLRVERQRERAGLDFSATLIIFS